MQVIILAGGRGTRLHPYTVALPKPLVPVGDRPIIDILLRQLHHCGADDVVISTGHLSGLVRAYLGDGSRYGLRVRFLEEDRPLGTAGPLALLPDPADSFLVVNGDILTTLDFSDFFRQHRDDGASATLAVRRREVPVDFGVVELSAEGLLAEYREKPCLGYLVSMGVNAFRRESLRFMKPGESLGMPEFLLRLAAGGERVRGIATEAEWLDIGRPEDFAAANDRAAANPAAYSLD